MRTKERERPTDALRVSTRRVLLTSEQPTLLVARPHRRANTTHRNNLISSHVHNRLKRGPHFRRHIRRLLPLSAPIAAAGSADVAATAVLSTAAWRAGPARVSSRRARAACRCAAIARFQHRKPCLERLNAQTHDIAAVLHSGDVFVLFKWVASTCSRPSLGLRSTIYTPHSLGLLNPPPPHTTPLLKEEARNNRNRTFHPPLLWSSQR